MLAPKLNPYRGTDAIVLGLARGGIVVASRVAKYLGSPLDVLVVKKIPSPVSSELGIGAVAPDEVSVVDWRLAQSVGADEAYVKRQKKRLAEEIKERTNIYRRRREPLSLLDTTVLLVDDGAATGATMEAAVAWAKKKGASNIVVALPVAHPDVVSKLTGEVKELVILEVRSDLSAVGQFYKEFHQLDDREVVELLA